MNSKVAVVIPAGGNGSRISKDKKKQFFTHKEKSLLEWSIEPLFSLGDQLKMIIIAIPEDIDELSQSLLPKHEKIKYCTGGSTRQKSVFNGLKFLHSENFEGTCVVHDAARPCLDTGKLKNLVEKIQESNEGGVLCVKVADTVKKANANMEVKNTIDRMNLWYAQTPQGGPFNKLYDANLLAIQEDIVVTDDASILENAGVPVHIVEDSRSNVKITCVEDWEIFIKNY